jgi:cytosine/adenosine deaminase-related metal-dependent hydrolase
MVTVVRGRWVVADDGDGPRVLEDGGVAVQGDTIAAVGPWTEISGAYPAADVLGGPNAAVMPGIVNAHHHANAITHIQQGIADDVLEPWILGNSAMRPVDGHLGTLFASGRLLKTGVTAVVDMASYAAASDETHTMFVGRLDGYEKAGIRGVLCPGMRFLSRLVHNEDAAFLETLPAALRARVQAEIMDQPTGSVDDYLDIVADLLARVEGMRFAAVGYGPPGPQWVGDEAMQRIAELAAAHDTIIQTHAQESLMERQEGPRRHGRSTIAHMAHLGVLSDRLSFAHAVWASAADIALLAESGAAVSHNPSSNLRLRSGVAPLPAMLAAGVTVGLGMDGTTIGDDEDYYAEMRLALRLHRAPRFADPVPTPEDILGLATTGGARLMRRPDIGRLAVGMQADLAVLDLSRATWPWVAPEVAPVAFLLQRAKAGDVSDVLIAGEHVLRAGEPTRFDMAAVGEEIAATLGAAPANLERADLVADLLPHLRAFYADWAPDDLTPYTAMNSRT